MKVNTFGHKISNNYSNNPDLSKNKYSMNFKPSIFSSDITSEIDIKRTGNFPIYDNTQKNTFIEEYNPDESYHSNRLTNEIDKDTKNSSKIDGFNKNTQNLVGEKLMEYP